MLVQSIRRIKMENLSKVLETKILSDLKEDRDNLGSNLKEPSVKMLNAVIGLIKEGKSFWDIQVAVKKQFEQGISKGQLKQVKEAMKARISELTPVKKEEVILQ
jgi:hypothetical protein